MATYLPLHSSRCPVLIARPTRAEWERDEELEEQQVDQALLSELHVERKT